MFEFRDLFQWDRFITPTIIKTFYWLVIALITLFGLSGIFSALTAMAISPFGSVGGSLGGGADRRRRSSKAMTSAPSPGSAETRRCTPAAARRVAPYPVLIPRIACSTDVKFMPGLR